VKHSKLSIAYHEAGHAVIGLRLGFEIDTAQINIQEIFIGRGTRGIVYSRDPRWKLQHDSRYVRDIMASQTGEIAQHLCSDPFEKQNEWGGDHRHIRSRARKACKGDEAKADALIERLHRQTEKLVQDNRDAIERVALALMERGYLTGEEIKGLLGERDWSSPRLDEMPFTPALRELYDQKGIRRW
jgi:ATP-dependent Zn protease